MVVVDGAGGLAEQTALLLADFAREFQVSEVVVAPRAVMPSQLARLRALTERGVGLAVADADRKVLETHGIPVAHGRERAREKASVVVLGTHQGAGQRADMEALPRLRGAVVLHGSEAAAFGTPVAWDVNHRARRKGADRWLAVPSAVAQAMAHVCAALGGRVQSRVAAALDARFVVLEAAAPMEAAVDVASGAVWQRPEDGRHGTPAAAVGHALLKEAGAEVPLFASAAEAGHQLLHTLHFSVTLAEPTTLPDLLARVRTHPRLGVTSALSQNPVAAFGRDHGWGGRLLNSVMLSEPTLSLQDGRVVTGICFAPDEGLVTYTAVAATLFLLDADGAARRLEALKPYVFDQV